MTEVTQLVSWNSSWAWLIGQLQAVRWIFQFRGALWGPSGICCASLLSQ